MKWRKMSKEPPLMLKITLMISKYRNTYASRDTLILFLKHDFFQER